ncbi:MAG: PorV/PorQ family protein [Candidatus Edwardsbacteria bacterium]
MKKIFLTLVLTIGISNLLGAVDYSNVGKAGVVFLKVGIGSRAIAMGEAFTAVANDASALYWNPAGLVNLKTPEFIFNHTEWIAGISHDYIGYVAPAGLIGTFGVSATLLSTGEMERTQIDDPTTPLREDEGEGLRPFTSSNFALGVTYAYRFTDKFSVGLTSKYVREKISEMSCSGIGFDLGTYYWTGFKTLRIGMGIANFGADLKFHGKDLEKVITDTSWQGNWTGNYWEIQATPFPMPLRFKMGIACDFLNTPLHRLTVATDMVHPNDGKEKVMVGAEYTWKNFVSLRAGYKYDPDLYEDRFRMSENMSLGGGLSHKFGRVATNVDYAYVDHGRLASVHRFSVGLKF